MKKKLLVAICLVTMTAMLGACGKDKVDPSTSADTANPTATEEPVEQSPVVEEPITDGDFIYKNSNKTEIIGLSDNGKVTMDLIFPENVTKISNVYVPAESLLHTVYFMNPDVVLENVSFANSRVEEIQNFPTTFTEIPDNMFNGCTRLTTLGSTKGVITIPDGVTSIGSGAFSGCSSITSVDFNNVTEVKDYAFQGCTSLKNLTWTKVENIGDAAFFAAGVTEVTLPDTCKTLGAIVFFRCTNLTSLNINNVESVNQELCRECTSLTDFYANVDFEATVTESSDNTSGDAIDAYSTLFANCDKVTLHISTKSALAEYLNNHPNSNFTVVED